jgi:hypothetical protein
MAQKDSDKELRLLHSEVLRAHALLLKKHDKMVESDKKITAPAQKGTVSKKDIANYTKARNEANEAHEKWASAQLKYFKFIEKNRAVLNRSK